METGAPGLSSVCPSPLYDGRMAAVDLAASTQAWVPGRARLAAHSSMRQR